VDDAKHLRDAHKADTLQFAAAQAEVVVKEAERKVAQLKLEVKERKLEVKQAELKLKEAELKFAEGRATEAEVQEAKKKVNDAERRVTEAEDVVSGEQCLSRTIRVLALNMFPLFSPGSAVKRRRLGSGGGSISTLFFAYSGV